MSNDEMTEFAESFSEFDLDPRLLDAVARKGFTRPTSIQQQMLPAAMEQQDILASAPTGTGKTIAFLLPALQYLLDYPRRKPGFARVIVLAPTRELAVQVAQQARELAGYTDLKVGLITGGVDFRGHDELLEKNLDLLVATPGRLSEYLQREKFELIDLELLILDEADRMLDMGFGPTVRSIATEAKRRQQTYLISATLIGPGVEKFASEILSEPMRVSIDAPRRERAKIHEFIHLADHYDHKLALLDSLLKQEQVTRSLVFVKTRERVMALMSQLQGLGHQVAFLRGEMSQELRKEQVKRFRSGKVPVLLATDVAARGLDIDDISHVINFDLPHRADVYVHRIGRTARAGAKGTAISLVEAHDMANLSRIERFTEQKLARRVIDGLRPKHKEASLPTKSKVKGKKKKSASKTKSKTKSTNKRSANK